MDNSPSPSIAPAAVGTALCVAIIAAAVATFIHVIGGVLTP